MTTQTPDRSGAVPSIPAGPAVDEQREPARVARFASWVPHAAVVLALGWWVLPLSRAGAGVDPWSLTPAVVACLPLLLVAGSRHLRPGIIALALAPGAIALALNLTSRTGWNGLDTAGTLLYAALLGLGVLSYARTPGRRLVVLSLVAIGALDQFGQAWLAWWGGGDVDALMAGTFGWHNPFAAFVAAPLVVGWCLVMRGTGVARTGASLLVPWLGAAVLLSGSRATLGLVVATALGLLLFAVRSWGEAARLGLAAAAAPLAAWLLSSSWLMPSGSAVATTALGRDEAAAGSLVLRGHYDWAALQLAGRHPVTGAGFDSYGPAGAQFMPSDVAASEFVHNGWLQALVDGGLLLALPVLVVTAWPALRALRRLLTGRRAGANAIQLGVSSAVLVLLAHALFDMDWRYPSLLALYAVLAALLPWRSRSPEPSSTQVVAVTTVLVAAVLVTGAVALSSTVREFPAAAPPAWARAVDSVLPFRTWAAALPTSAEDAALMIGNDLDDEQFLAVFARTAAAAADDPALAQVRALALITRGETLPGVELSDQALPDDPRPPVVLLRAEVLDAAGRRDAAVAWVAEERDRIEALQGNVPTAELEEWLAAHSTTDAEGVGVGRSGTVPSGEAGT